MLSPPELYEIRNRDALYPVEWAINFDERELIAQLQYAKATVQPDA